jgi:acyl carrier protein
MTTLSLKDVRQAVIDSVLTVAPEADFSTVKPDQSLRDQIDLDSFDFLNVLIALHDTLGIDIPESDYANLTTLDSIVDYIASKVPIAT